MNGFNCVKAKDYGEICVYVLCWKPFLFVFCLWQRLNNENIHRIVQFGCVKVTSVYTIHTKEFFFSQNCSIHFYWLIICNEKKSVILMPRKKKTNLYSRYETNKKWDDNMLNKTSALLCWLSSCLRDFHVIKYQISLRWMFFHHCWMVK